MRANVGAITQEMAARLDGDGRVLTGGSTAEVLAGHNDVARLDVVDKLLVDVFHAVGGQFLVGSRVQIPGGNDHVRVNIITVRCTKPCAFMLLPPQSSFSGSVIKPVTALAAATAGLAR